LRKHRGNIGDVVVDQGVEISRPSRLYLDVRDVLRVGGKVRSVMRGELSVESFA
jgi:predicted PhzF superfamily epimerase YddE/YHI9